MRYRSGAGVERMTVPPERVIADMESLKERRERQYIESLHEPLFEIEDKEG